MGGRIKDAVKDQKPRRFVELVFVFGALGDLDDGKEIVGRNAGDADVVPNIHNYLSDVFFIINRTAEKINP